MQIQHCKISLRRAYFAAQCNEALMTLRCSSLMAGSGKSLSMRSISSFCSTAHSASGTGQKLVGLCVSQVSQ